MCLQCDIGELPKELTPVKLETKFIETTEVPEIVKEIIRKFFVFRKMIDKKFPTSFIEIEEPLNLEWFNNNPEFIKIEALIIPTEFKVSLFC